MKLIKILSVVVLLSCSKGQMNQNNVKNETGTTTSDSYKKHLLTSQQADLLAQEYMKGNYAVINKSRKSDAPDSREAYYDLEVLEGYIQYVKGEAQKRGISNPGIKIAFGQYPTDKVIDPRQSEKYKGYQTVFLMPVVMKKGDSLQNKNSTNKGDDFDGVSGLDFSELRPPN